MTLDIVDTTEPKVAPIDLTAGDHYERYRKRLAQEEAELAELEREARGDPEPATDEEIPDTAAAPVREVEAVVDPDEVSFKKRYGDLRRHAQKQERELNSRIKELEKAIQAGPQTSALPATEAELREWMEAYPDLGRVVETIALQKSGAVAEELNQFKQDLAATRTEAAREKAILQIRKVHTDFDEIVNDASFHEWVQEQPQYIIDALYYNQTDSKAAIRAIDLYKADVGISKKTKPATNDKENSRTVVRPGTVQVQETPKNMFKESEIHAMSPRDYAKHEAEIDKAIREGRVDWDMSGGAR